MFLILEGRDVDGLAKDYGDLIYDYGDRGGKLHGPTQYNKAIGIDDKAAMMSTSYGFGQVMGFNYKEAGYNSVEEFVADQSTYEGQVNAFVNFVSNSPGLVKALRSKDYSTFAKLYNGSDYKTANNYDENVKKQYEKLSE